MRALIDVCAVFEGGMSFEYLIEAPYDMIQFIVAQANRIIAARNKAHR